MITGELKNKIDAIWQDFYNENMAQNGDVVNQLTTLMFIKMLDDRQTSLEAQASILNIKPKQKDLIFKDGIYSNSEYGINIPYEQLRWKNFKNLNSKDLANRLKSYVIPFIKDLGNLGGENKEESEILELTAFSKFAQDLSYKFDAKERLLTSVVDKLSDPSIDFSNLDIMGDFYEYLLDGRMTGQFRTPRHIIALANELIKPKLGEKIIDPACGSAGFLIGAANYIQKNQERELVKVENKKTFTSNTFWAVDNDKMMARISSMNMMLHGIKKPHISADSLLEAENAKELMNNFDVILANPPFSGSLVESAINGSLLAIADTKQTELLFVTLFLKLLKIGGRCISVVPDGVLVNNNEKAYKNLRQELIEKQKLIAIISMPSGIFQPYTLQKTSLIIFQKTNRGGTDKVWYYDMHSDGYSLGKKRKPTKANDIPDIIYRFNNLHKENDRSREDKSFFITLDEIRKNDYDLSLNKYTSKNKLSFLHRTNNEIIEELEQLQEKHIKSLKELKDILGNNDDTN
jgi:type I restriction enzyme M protein